MIVLGFGDVLLRVCVCGNSLKYHVEVFKLFVFIYFHQDYNLTDFLPYLGIPYMVVLLTYLTNTVELQFFVWLI